MFFVGIDVASEKHDCCILSSEGSPVSQFSFDNSANGFCRLLSEISAFAPVSDIKIGLEATGIYGTNLEAFLRRKGYSVLTLNPLAVKQSIKATTLRKNKTDKADAKAIAMLVRRESSEPDLQPSYHMSELKSLCRARFHAVKDRSRAKLKIRKLVMLLFPELTSFFSSLYIVSALALLEKYPSAKRIAACRVDTLTRLLETSSRGRFGKEEAVELKKLARQSIGTFSSSAELELSFAIDELKLFDRHVEAYEVEIKAIMDELHSTITMVPGIGVVLGAMILSELRDIHAFSSPAKVLAFAGLDPSVYQSGKFIPSSGSMVKRGSPYLRWALTSAARTVAQHSVLFSSYLNKKLSEGKHYNVAISHVAKKLVRVLFSILTHSAVFFDQIAS